MTRDPFVLKVGAFEYVPEGGNIVFGRYANGEIAMRIISDDGEPLAMATVNPEHPPFSARSEQGVWLKGWSENEGLPEALEKAGIVELEHQFARCGYVQAEFAVLTEKAWTAFMKSPAFA